MSSTTHFTGSSDEAAALPITGGYVVRPAQPVLRPPPTPTRPGGPLPEVIGYRTPRSGSKTRRPPGRGGPPQFPPPPSIRSAPHTPGSPSRLRFYTASMAFTLISEGSALPAPPEDGTSNDAAGFASCYGPHRRSPLTGLSTLGSGPARFQAKPPACYRASWQLPGPDSHRQATTSLRTRRSTMALRHGVTSVGDFVVLVSCRQPVSVPCTVDALAEDLLGSDLGHRANAHTRAPADSATGHLATITGRSGRRIPAIDTDRYEQIIDLAASELVKRLTGVTSQLDYKRRMIMLIRI